MFTTLAARPRTSAPWAIFRIIAEAARNDSDFPERHSHEGERCKLANRLPFTRAKLRTAQNQWPWCILWPVRYRSILKTTTRTTIAVSNILNPKGAGVSLSDCGVLARRLRRP